MNIREATRYDIIKMAWKALPHCEEGDVVVVVDVRDGSIEALSKTEDFENWAKDSFDYKKVLFHITEKEAGFDIDTLIKRYHFEVYCRMLEIKEQFPYLK